MYSTGAPRTKARPKPEWNPYKTTNDAYGRLTAGQQEKRREMFKSKNNILLSPEAKAKDIKEKVSCRYLVGAYCHALPCICPAFFVFVFVFFVSPNPAVLVARRRRRGLLLLQRRRRLQH